MPWLSEQLLLSWNTRDKQDWYSRCLRKVTLTPPQETQCIADANYTLPFSFIYKIKEFLSKLFGKATGAQVRRAWKTRAVFANLSNNSILICCTPCKNEVTLFNEVNQNSAFSGSCDFRCTINLVTFQNCKAWTTHPSFLLEDLEQCSDS